MARESNKWKRKSLRKKPRKIIPGIASTSSLSQSYSADSTSDPEQQNLNETDSALELWLNTNRDQTQIQELDQFHEPEIFEGYVETWAAFADKYTQYVLKQVRTNLVSLTVLGWFVFIMWMFTQAYGSGKIDNTAGFQWFGIQVGIVSFLTIVVSAVVAIFWRTSTEL